MFSLAFKFEEKNMCVLVWISYWTLDTHTKPTKHLIHNSFLPQHKIYSVKTKAYIKNENKQTMSISTLCGGV